MSLPKLRPRQIAQRLRRQQEKESNTSILQSEHDHDGESNLTPQASGLSSHIVNAGDKRKMQEHMPLNVHLLPPILLLDTA